MFNPRKHRILSALLLATYVVASSASALWHRHGENATCSAGVAHCEHHHDQTAERDDHDVASSASTSASSASQSSSAATLSATHQHDDCAICRFLAQRVLTVAPATIEERGTLVTLLPITESDGPSLDLARTTQARAPPSVG